MGAYLVAAGYYISPELTEYLKVLSVPGVGLLLAGAVIKGKGKEEAAAIAVAAAAAIAVAAAAEFNPEKKHRAFLATGYVAATVPILSSIINKVPLLEAGGITLLGAGVGAAIAGIGNGMRKKFQALMNRKKTGFIDEVQSNLKEPSTDIISSYFVHNTDELSSYCKDHIPKMLSKKEAKLKAEAQTIGLHICEGEDTLTDLRDNKDLYSSEDFKTREDAIQVSITSYKQTQEKVARRQQDFNKNTKELHAGIKRIEKQIIQVKSNNSKRKELDEKISKIHESAQTRPVKSDRVIGKVDDSFKQEVLEMEHLVTRVLCQTALDNNGEVSDSINSESTTLASLRYT